MLDNLDLMFKFIMGLILVSSSYSQTLKWICSGIVLFYIIAAHRSFFGRIPYYHIKTIKFTVLMIASIFNAAMCLFIFDLYTTTFEIIVPDQIILGWLILEPLFLKLGLAYLEHIMKGYLLSNVQRGKITKTHAMNKILSVRYFLFKEVFSALRARK